MEDSFGESSVSQEATLGGYLWCRGAQEGVVRGAGKG